MKRNREEMYTMKKCNPLRPVLRAAITICALGCVCLAPLVSTSCASTPIRELPPQQAYRIPAPEESGAAALQQMEFIGFKANTTLLSVAASSSGKDPFLLNMLGGSNHGEPSYTSGYEYWRDVRDSAPMLRFPQLLAEGNIAADESALYFGDFSPQDLAVYRSERRYVTFVDVMETQLSWKDSGSSQKAWASTGGAFTLGGAAGFLAMLADGFDFNTITTPDVVGLSLSAASVLVGQLCLIPSFRKPKSTFVFSGRYAICVYDTQQQKLVTRKIVDVEQQDTLSGSFESDSTDRSIVYAYYGQCLANALLEAYASVPATLP